MRVPPGNTGSSCVKTVSSVSPARRASTGATSWQVGHSRLTKATSPGGRGGAAGTTIRPASTPRTKRRSRRVGDGGLAAHAPLRSLEAAAADADADAPTESAGPYDHRYARRLAYIIAAGVDEPDSFAFLFAAADLGHHFGAAAVRVSPIDSQPVTPRAGHDDRDGGAAVADDESGLREVGEFVAGPGRIELVQEAPWRKGDAVEHDAGLRVARRGHRRDRFV